MTFLQAYSNEANSGRLAPVAKWFEGLLTAVLRGGSEGVPARL